MQTAVKSDKNAKLDQKFISPFAHAVKNVMSTMAKLDVAAQAPQLIHKSKCVGDIASVMPMKSPDLEGQLVVSFKSSTLMAITSRLIMEECTEVDQLVLDTAGELTNMVTGAAKVLLEQNGYDFDMARPQTYQGKELKSLKLIGGPRMLIPYNSEVGELFIDLGFDAV